MLAFTINSDLTHKVKQRLTALQRRLEGVSKTASTKKMRAKGSESTEEELTLSEIREISQTVSNMEVLQQEEANFHNLLVQQTEKISARMVSLFK